VGGAEGVVDVHVSQLRERRPEAVDLCLRCFGLRAESGNVDLVFLYSKIIIIIFIYNPYNKCPIWASKKYYTK